MYRSFFTVTALLFMISTSYSHAEIYKWVDGNGKVHFSNSKVDAEKKQEVIEIKSPNVIGDQASVDGESNENSQPHFSSQDDTPYVATDEKPLTPHQQEYNRTLAFYKEQLLAATRSRSEADQEQNRLGALDKEFGEWTAKNCKYVEKGGYWATKRKDGTWDSGYDSKLAHMVVECSAKPSRFSGIDDGSYRNKYGRLADEASRKEKSARSTKKTLDALKEKIEKTQ